MAITEKRSKRVYPEKVCANPDCAMPGGKYIPTDRRQIYCSPQCGINARNDRRFRDDHEKFAHAKILKKNYRILEMLYKNSSENNIKSISPETLNLLKFELSVFSSQTINEKSGRMVSWYHDMGLELTDSMHFIIHKL
jgi:hypothetical protein